MANSKNVIELNGKRYDALTGKLIHKSVSHEPKAKAPAAHKPAVTAPVKKTPARPASGRVQLVDGFIRNPHLRTKQAPVKPAQHKASVPTDKPVKARTVAKHAARNKTRQQKAHTLMRSAVKKPALREMVSVPATAPVVMPTPVNRIGRADRIQKSSMISRFGSIAQSNVVKKTEAVPVKPAPVHAHHANAHITQRSNPIFDIALSQAAAVDKEKPERNKHKKHRLHHRAGARVGFNKKATNIIMSAGVFLVLGGFFAYQNVPNLNLRVAAARAGVRASLPGYQPTGFGVAGIYAKPGQITIRFDGDGKEYSVTQTTSNWNSETLLQNQVAANNQAFQSFQDKGNTIYIYGDTNAAWVNGGVLYEIKSGGSLTSDQLLKIAQSI